MRFNLSHHKITQLAHKQLVWFILIAIWLFLVNVSLVHSQKHLVVTDYQCQLCLNNYSHTPFVLINNLVFTPEIQISQIVIHSFISHLRVHQLELSNRDPPL